MDNLQGQLLISGGGLFDPNFRHTVVLVGAHNAEGALGGGLNRELDVGVEDAAPALHTLVPPGEHLFHRPSPWKVTGIVLAAAPGGGQ